MEMIKPSQVSLMVLMILLKLDAGALTLSGNNSLLVILVK